MSRTIWQREPKPPANSLPPSPSLNSPNKAFDASLSFPPSGNSSASINVWYNVPQITRPFGEPKLSPHNRNRRAVRPTPILLVTFHGSCIHHAGNSDRKLFPKNADELVSGAGLARLELRRRQFDIGFLNDTANFICGNVGAGLSGRPCAAGDRFSGRTRRVSRPDFHVQHEPSHRLVGPASVARAEFFW